jgi:hypothetical protein
VGNGVVVPLAHDYLRRVLLLEEEVALTIIAEKIGVRSKKAVLHHLHPKVRSTDQPVRGPGRPPIISDEKMAELKQWIVSEYNSTRYVTIDDIFNWLLADDGVSEKADLTHNTLQHILRDAGFIAVKSVPQEPGRISLTSAQINGHFETLAEKSVVILRGWLSMQMSLVFNHGPTRRM